MYNNLFLGCLPLRAANSPKYKFTTLARKVSVSNQRLKSKSVPHFSFFIVSYSNIFSTCFPHQHLILFGAQPDECVACVPLEAVLSVRAVFGGSLAVTSLFQLDAVLRTMPNLQLALAVLHERRLSADSPFAPYLRVHCLQFCLLAKVKSVYGRR